MRSYNQKISLYGEFGSKVSTFNYAVKNIPDSSDQAFIDAFPSPQRDYKKSDSPVTRSDSIKRSLDRIFDISVINSFSHFVTFTFNDSIISGYDYVEALRAIRRWFSNRVQIGDVVRYLFVPELHPSSGRIHFHGLVFFNDESSLIDSGHVDSHHRVIYNISSWRNGFTTAVKLDSNRVGVACYITKYITKELSNFVSESRITKRFYYAGGDISLSPSVFWSNADFDSADGTEVDITFRGSDSPYKVKYQFVSHDQGENYAYFEDITDYPSDILF